MINPFARFKRLEAAVEEMRRAVESLSDGGTSIYSCSFCGAGSHQVDRLILGRGNVAICDGCVLTAQEVIREKAA